MHRIFPEETVKDKEKVPASQFVLKGRYSSHKFQGIIPDTGAAQYSTAGHKQYLALRHEDASMMINKERAGEALIQFGKGAEIRSIGAVQVNTPLGVITFHIIKAPTPFLLCMQDMDKLNVYFDNTINQIVQKGDRPKHVPVIQKWGHPWFHVSKHDVGIFFTETELRRIYRQFGHPTVNRLNRVLKNTGHKDMDIEALETITKMCHHCQLHDSAPRRFKFTLKDDQDFNYELIVDVMYLSGKPVLHVVDAATSFQAARFLRILSAKDTWEALRATWIDTYLGPPDYVVHDAGTNFASAEFQAEAKLMGITCKQIPVEAHWSIGKVERYHGPVRRAFNILHAKLGDDYSQDTILQMAVKAVNDTAGPNRLVPTLLVFRAYPRINTESQPSTATTHRAETV